MTELRNFLAILLTLCLSVTALANDGWNKGSDYNRLFDTDTVTTLRGEVLDIQRDVRLLPGMAPAVVATLETADGPVTVHLGPKWFTKFYQEKFDIQAGDQVEVTGSMVDYQGTQTMMLQAGRKGDLEMVIRDNQGAPVWDPEAKHF